MLVVLVLLAVAAGLVAPAFLRPPRASEPEFAALVRRAQDVAAARGETVSLGLSVGGAWRLDGTAALGTGPIATGQLRGYGEPRGTLIVSAIGSCAWDVRSSAAARAMPLDPLTCTAPPP